jgi:hypothetical protein
MKTFRTRSKGLVAFCVLLVFSGKIAFGMDALKKVIDAQPWVVYNTDSIHLYCLPNSEAERDQKLILQKRTEALKEIEAFFGKTAPQTIKVFLLPHQEGINFPIGTAWPAYFFYTNLYQPGKWSYEKHNFGHEITHIFSNMDEHFQEQTYPIGLLDEGIAEYLSGYTVDPHLRITHHWQAHGVNYAQIKIQPRNLHYGSPSLYPISGSFVKHLIEGYQNGPKKFLSLLKRTNRKECNEEPDFPKFVTSLEEVYEKPFATIMDEWNKVLKPYWEKTMPLTDDDREKIRATLTESNNGKLLGVFYDGFKRYLRICATTSKGNTRFLQANSEDTWAIEHLPSEKNHR